MRSSLHNFIPAVAAAALLLVPACVRAAEGNFEKTLTVSGNATLNVSTGSGYIRINPGSDNQIHIVGHVKAGNWLDERLLKERGRTRERSRQESSHRADRKHYSRWKRSAPQ